MMTYSVAMGKSEECVLVQFMRTFCWMEITIWMNIILLKCSRPRRFLTLHCEHYSLTNSFLLMFFCFSVLYVSHVKQICVLMYFVETFVNHFSVIRRYFMVIGVDCLPRWIVYKIFYCVYGEMTKVNLVYLCRINHCIILTNLSG